MKGFPGISREALFRCTGSVVKSVEDFCRKLPARLHRNHLLALGFVVHHDFFHAVAHVLFAGHVVPCEYGIGQPTPDSFRNVLAATAANEISRSTSAQVMHQRARTAGRFAGRRPALPKFADGLTGTMEYQRR